MATATKNLSEYDKTTIPNAKPFRFGIVVSEWNNQITENLYLGAAHVLIENGALPENVIRKNVPGSFELIYGCSQLQKDNFDAIIAIGSVVKGETKHFDFICESVSQGLKDLNILRDIPVIFCVLTDNTMQQAIDRSGGKYGNKGIECAIAAIKMAAFSK